MIWRWIIEYNHGPQIREQTHHISIQNTIPYIPVHQLSWYDCDVTFLQELFGDIWRCVVDAQNWAQYRVIEIDKCTEQHWPHHNLCMLTPLWPLHVDPTMTSAFDTTDLTFWCNTFQATVSCLLNGYISMTYTHVCIRLPLHLHTWQLKCRQVSVFDGFHPRLQLSPIVANTSLLNDDTTRNLFGDLTDADYVSTYVSQVGINDLTWFCPAATILTHFPQCVVITTASHSNFFYWFTFIMRNFS